MKGGSAARRVAVKKRVYESKEGRRPGLRGAQAVACTGEACIALKGSFCGEGGGNLEKGLKNKRCSSEERNGQREQYRPRRKTKEVSREILSGEPLKTLGTRERIRTRGALEKMLPRCDLTWGRRESQGRKKKKKKVHRKRPLGGGKKGSA